MSRLSCRSSATSDTGRHHQQRRIVAALHRSLVHPQSAVAALPKISPMSEGVAQSICTESIDSPVGQPHHECRVYEAACPGAHAVRASLGVPGDPHRYPDNAIEAGRKVKEVATPVA